MLICVEYMMKNSQMAEKSNLSKLTQNLIKKLNDPKEIIRKEIERLFLDLSYVHMNYM